MLLTPEQLNAKGARIVHAELLADMHRYAVSQFTDSAGDYRRGYWNGFAACAAAVLDVVKGYEP